MGLSHVIPNEPGLVPMVAPHPRSNAPVKGGHSVKHPITAAGLEKRYKNDYRVPITVENLCLQEGSEPP